MSTLQQNVSLVILICTAPDSIETTLYQITSKIQHVKKKKVKSKLLPFHKNKKKRKNYANKQIFISDMNF